jgi:Predicted transcriptional regulator
MWATGVMRMSEASGVARLPEVEQVSGLSRSSIYRLEASGDFPGE